MKRAFSYGAASSTSNADRPLLTYYNTRFGEDGFKLPSLLRTITMSDAFSRIAVPPSPAPVGKTAQAPSTTAVAANAN